MNSNYKKPKRDVLNDEEINELLNSIHKLKWNVKQRSIRSATLSQQLNISSETVQQAQFNLFHQLQSSPMHSYQIQLKNAYKLSNQTNFLWLKSSKKAKETHAKWFAKEKQAHELSRQVIQTYRDHVNTNISLPNATSKILKRTTLAEIELSKWRTMLPSMKRSVEEEEQALKFLTKETLALTKHIQVIETQRKKSGQNIDLGKALASKVALDEVKRGLIKGKERMSDLQNQYDNGVLMYRALTKTTQDFQRERRRIQTLRLESNSKSFSESKNMDQIHNARNLLKMDKIKLKKVEKKLFVVTRLNMTGKTASEKMDVALNRLELGEALEKIAFEVKRARKTVLVAEQTARRNGVNVLQTENEKEEKTGGATGSSSAATGSTRSATIQQAELVR